MNRQEPLMDFEQEIERLKSSWQYRQLKIADQADNVSFSLNGKTLVNFGSNNYLGMAHDPEVKRAFIEGIEKWGTGAGASRLLSGSCLAHQELEQALADFSKKEAALVFPSGYMANTGLLAALAEKKDWVILDKNNHASIIDGARLSGATVRIFPHLDLDALESLLKKAPAEAKKIIVTDTIFSMDGDAADLIRLAEIKSKYHAILVADEAHAIGIFGKNGAGLAVEKGVEKEVDFKVGTLSKAFGLQGGYISSSHSSIDYLKNKCRTFIYTTGILPAICHAALKALEIMINQEENRQELLRNASRIRRELEALHFPPSQSISQIIPVLIPDAGLLLKMEKQFMDKGLYIPAIRYPTVKKGQERFRISLTMNHKEDHLSLLLDSFSKTRFRDAGRKD